VNSKDVAQYTVGEYSQSLRPLTRRFSQVGTLRPGTTCVYNPMHFSVSGDSAQCTTTVDDKDSRTIREQSTIQNYWINETWQQLISHLYRFYAGSFRTKIHLGDRYGKVGVVTVSDTTLPIYSSPAALIQAPDPIYIQDGKTNSILESQTPFYSTNRMQIVGANYGREPNAISSAGAQFIQVSGVPDYKPHDIELYSAAGDDFSFGFLVAPPPVTPRSEVPFSI